MLFPLKIPKTQYCWSIFQDIQKYDEADFNIPAGRMINWYCKATLDVSLDLPRFYSNGHPYTPVARGNWNQRKPLVVFPPTRSRRNATQILLRRASIHFVRYHFVYHSWILKSSVWCVRRYVFSIVPLFARVTPVLQIFIFLQLILFPNIWSNAYDNIELFHHSVNYNNVKIKNSVFFYA